MLVGRIHGTSVIVAHARAHTLHARWRGIASRGGGEGRAHAHTHTRVAGGWVGWGGEGVHCDMTAELGGPCVNWHAQILLL